MNAVVHDPYSLSKSYRWLNCPGSIRRCQGVQEPVSQDTTFRDLGTLLHAICEVLTKIGTPAVESTEAHEVPDPIIALRPADMVDADWDDMLLKACRMWRKAMEAIGKLLQPGFTLAPEMPVDLECIGIMMPGFVDVYAIGIAATGPLAGTGTRVVIVDYKSGFVRVEAEDNSQLAGYAIGAVIESGADDAAVVIIQPGDEDAEDVYSRVWEMTPQAIDDWTEILRTGRRKAEYSDLLVPGDWCSKGYCPARMNCEARRSVLTAPIAVASLGNALEAMNSAQRGEWYSRLTEAMKWCEAAVSETKLLIQTTGLELDGWKWKKGASIRIWADKPAAERELKERCAESGIPETAIVEIKLKSPAALEKEGVLPAEIWGHLVGTKDNAPSLTAVKGKKC